MTDPAEGHTIQRYDSELGQLNRLMIEMGGLVLDQTQKALKALRAKDLDLAEEVSERDREVNNLELKADKKVVSIVALLGPVARDLRMTVSISKIITDLERIGDEAAKLGRKAYYLYKNDRNSPSPVLMRDVQTMGKMVVLVLRETMELLDTLDTDRAEGVAFGLTDMEDEFQSSLRRLSTYVVEDPRNIGHIVDIVLIIKALERIGDHARNIAEHVLYMVKGEDVRHQFDRLNSQILNNGDTLERRRPKAKSR